MKRITLFLAALLLSTNLLANVKMENEINNGTGWGNTKAFKSAPKEITVGLFNLQYLTTRVAGASAGTGFSKVGVSVRAELDLAEADAQAITDQAFAYLKKQLEAKGYKVNVFDAEALKNSKVFQKISKKDSAAVVSLGGTSRITDKNKVDERINTYANGVPGAYLGTNPGQGYTQLAMEMGGANGVLSVNLVGVIDFTEAVTKASDANMLDDYNRVSVAFAPTLRLIDNPQFGGQSSLNFNSSKAIGGKVFGGNIYKYDARDWIKQDGMNADSIWQYHIEPEAYKKAVSAMLKAYIDQLIARVEEAHTSGK